MIEAAGTAQTAEIAQMWIWGLCWVIGAILFIALFKALSPYMKEIPKDLMNIFGIIGAYVRKVFTYESGHGNHYAGRDRQQPHAPLQGKWAKSETGGFRYVPAGS